MNYLAHVLLAEPTGPTRLGALMGDFAQGLCLERLPEAVRRGLLEHRAVDGYVDRHPLVRAERAHFPPDLRRFAGILLDVYYDHFLVRHWERFAEEPLPEVTGQLYAALERHAELLPPRLARIAPAMIQGDWLASYGDAENVGRALRGMARRMRRESPLAEGLDELRRRYAELEQHFLLLFPAVQAFVEERRGDLPGQPRTPGSAPRYVASPSPYTGTKMRSLTRKALV